MERQFRLFVSAGFAIASFWGVERCQDAFGDGDYRGGWFLLDDDAVEVEWMAPGTARAT